MINFNEKLLEKHLFDQFIDNRGISLEDRDSYYLVVESIEFLIDDYDLKPPYLVKLRYGKENDFCIHTELFLGYDWGYDFIKGYFQKHLEDTDEWAEGAKNEKE